MLTIPNDLLPESRSMTKTFDQRLVGLSGDEVRAKALIEDGTTSSYSGLTTGGDGSELVVGFGENAKDAAHAEGVPSSVSGYDNGFGGGACEDLSSVNNSHHSQVRLGGGCCV